LPLEEFVKLKDSEFRRNKRLLLASAKDLRGNRGEDLLWHLRGFDACIGKAVELLGRATREVLVSFWPEHGRYIEDALRQAVGRGVLVFSMQFAAPWLELGTVYRHVPIEALHDRHGSELCLAVDDTYGFFMRQVPGRDWEGYWTASPGVARLVVNYIRHDIYINRAIHDFADEMFARYGPQLERLIEI
jgi:sugar-specific transcriptional regulator TrmB